MLQFPVDVVQTIIEVTSHRPTLASLALVSRVYYKCATRNLYEFVVITNTPQLLRFLRTIFENIKSGRGRPAELFQALHGRVHILHLSFAQVRLVGKALSSVALAIPLLSYLEAVVITMKCWDPDIVYDIIGKDIGMRLSPTVKTFVIRVSPFPFSPSSRFLMRISRRYG